jgi:dephospho-CoA kinase
VTGLKKSEESVIYIEAATFFRLFNKKERRRVVDGSVAICCNEEETRRRLKIRNPELTEVQINDVLREQVPWKKQMGFADHAFDTSSMSLEDYEKLVREFLHDSH